MVASKAIFAVAVVSVVDTVVADDFVARPVDYGDLDGADASNAEGAIWAGWVDSHLLHDPSNNTVADLCNEIEYDES